MTHHWSTQLLRRKKEQEELMNALKSSMDKSQIIMNISLKTLYHTDIAESANKSNRLGPIIAQSAISATWGWTIIVHGLEIVLLLKIINSLCSFWFTHFQVARILHLPWAFMPAPICTTRKRISIPQVARMKAF